MFDALESKSVHYRVPKIADFEGRRLVVVAGGDSALLFLGRHGEVDFVSCEGATRTEIQLRWSIAIVSYYEARRGSTCAVGELDADSKLVAPGPVLSVQWSGRESPSACLFHCTRMQFHPGMNRRVAALGSRRSPLARARTTKRRGRRRP